MTKPKSKAKRRISAVASPPSAQGSGKISGPLARKPPGKAIIPRPIIATEQSTAGPGAYDAVAAASVCRRLAEGESLRHICDDKSMPSRQTLRHWLDTVPVFADQHHRARRHQADALIDAAIETAHEALAHDNAASVRVKIDALLKLAAQLGARLRGDAENAAGNFDLAAAITAARARLAKARQIPPAPTDRAD